MWVVEPNHCVCTANRTRHGDKGGGESEDYVINCGRTQFMIKEGTETGCT